MAIKYIPDQGDIVSLNFNPQTGHEQRGRRPALVLSKKEYNQRTGLAIFCPITSREGGYPFEVKLKTKKTKGVVLADQLKSLDYVIRKSRFVERVSKDTFKKVTALSQGLLKD